MYCSNCHRQISDEAKFCTFCGTIVSKPSQPAQPMSPQTQAPAPAPIPSPQPTPAPSQAAPQPSPAPQPQQTYQAPPPAPQSGYSYPSQPQGMAIPQPLAGVMQLNYNEALKNIFGAEYQDRRSPMDDEGPRTYVVIIAATNQRLVFFLTSGVLKKTYQQMESIPLEQIQDISVSQGFVSRSFVVSFVRNGLMNGLNLSNPFFVDQGTLKSAGAMDPTGVKAMLDPLIAARKKEVGAPSAPAPVQAPAPQPAPVPAPMPMPPTPVAPAPAPAPQYAPPAPGTYAELKYKLNMAGFDVKTIRCSRCGSLIFLPDQGVSIQCANCQNVITAQEILDRAREALR